MSLTPKQEAFCLAYLETGNASEAYRRSYNTSRMTEKQVWEEASKLLKHPKVAQRLKRLNERATSAAVMTRQEALERLSKIARADVADLVEFGEITLGEGEDGRTIVQSAWKFKDSALQDRAKLSAVAELTAGRDGIKLKLHSPLQAIQQLAKMQGWDIHELDLEAKRLANEKARKELESGAGGQMSEILRELIAKLPG